MNTAAKQETPDSHRIARAFGVALRATPDGDDAEATRPLVDSLLADAVRERASDIHLDSQSDQVRVRFRIDGTVRDAASVPMKRGVKLLRYLKVNSNLDPAPSLLPADSHFDYELDGAALAIRLACAPCVFGDKISLRLFHGLPARQRLADIGLCVDDLARIQRWLGDISGMFVVAGPVGCGKTTTLYALLSELNLTQRQIITIEDPVEYRFENINQIEVNTKRGLTFEEGLRSILRLDPDYILLGEIRDKVSAMAAMEAAATGRVVLTTMHGRNATGVITALRSLGVSDYEIAASLAIIVGQRLVRKLCTDCRRLEPPTAQECHWLESLGEKAPGSVWRPGGCPQCAGTGYFERTGVFEVLPVDEQLYDMIVAGKDEHALRAHLRGEGFRLLLRDALAKAAEGFTDLSELTRIGAQSYLDQVK